MKVASSTWKALKLLMQSNTLLRDIVMYNAAIHDAWAVQKAPIKIVSIKKNFASSYI